MQFFDDNLPEFNPPELPEYSGPSTVDIEQMKAIVGSLIDPINQTLQSQGQKPIGQNDIDKFVEEQSSLITDLIFDTNPDFVDTKEKFNFEVLFRPKLKLVQIPYLTFEPVSIQESPSVPPIAYIYPIIGKKDEFIFWLTPSSGEYYDYPISILESDQEYFKNILLIQKSEDGKVFFKQENQTKSFQVFRTDYLPRSYSNFKLYKELSYPLETSMLEKIETDKAYYYCFRSVDIHGNISNPTEVFKVVMISNSGVFYPEITIVPINKEKFTEKSKPIKKFIKIQPSFLQTIYDELNERFGLSNESIFGKKFRLRITSKHTEKKFDIILNVNKSINEEVE